MWPKKQVNKPLLKPVTFCQTLCRGQNLRILPCPFSHCLQNVWQTPRQNYRSKRCHLGNVLKSATLLSATTECHSQNWERRRSATPFYQKERCGSGTHIFEGSEKMSGPFFSLFFHDIASFLYSFVAYMIFLTAKMPRETLIKPSEHS